MKSFLVLLLLLLLLLIIIILLNIFTIFVRKTVPLQSADMFPYLCMTVRSLKTRSYEYLDKYQ